MDPGRGTYSIVAADPATGEVGAAVQSRFFAVGAAVPWVLAGVGAVATQANTVAAYGPRALELIAGGADPETAIRETLAGDERRETRQLGAVTADGRAASFTGAECNEWAGDAQGAGYAVQGNILAGENVVRGMARAFEQTEGSLGERLMAALEAAEEAGGDRRGKQSAGLVVERAGAAAERRDGIDRIVDLRVDDHPEPILELRRLLGIRQGWDAMLVARTAYEAGDYERALELTLRLPDEPALLYNRACYASLAGRRDVALADLRRSIELDPSFVEMARADADFEPLAGDEELARLLK